MIGGTKFYERAEIKDALAYLTLLTNPADSVSFGRVVNSPRRGIGQTTVRPRAGAREHDGRAGDWRSRPMPRAGARASARRR